MRLSRRAPNFLPFSLLSLISSFVLILLFPFLLCSPCPWNCLLKAVSAVLGMDLTTQAEFLLNLLLTFQTDK